MKQFLLGLVVCLLVSTIPIVSFGSHDATIVKVSDGDHITAIDHINVITPVLSVDTYALIAPADVGKFVAEDITVKNTVNVCTLGDPVDYGLYSYYKSNFIYTTDHTVTRWNLGNLIFSILAVESSKDQVYKTSSVAFNKLE